MEPSKFSMDATPTHTGTMAAGKVLGLVPKNNNETRLREPSVAFSITQVSHANTLRV
jgi:hypothetical protein